MPSANKMTTPVAVDLPEIQGRYAELDGYTVGFESYPEDVDPAPLFAGPAGRPLPVPALGRRPDRPDHLPVGRPRGDLRRRRRLLRRARPPAADPAGTSLVEFSPSDGLQQTMAVIEANLATAGADDA